VLSILLVVACGGQASDPGAEASLFEAPEVTLPPGEPDALPSQEVPARVEAPDCVEARIRFEAEEARVVAYRTQTMGPIVEVVDRAREAFDYCLSNPEECGMETLKRDNALKSAEAQYEEALADLGTVEARLYPLHQSLLAACGG